MNEPYTLIFLHYNIQHKNSEKASRQKKIS